MLDLQHSLELLRAPMRTKRLVVLIPLEHQDLVRRLRPCHEAVRQYVGLVLLDPGGGVLSARTFSEVSRGRKCHLPEHIQDLFALSVLTGENRLHDDRALSERRC